MKSFTEQFTEQTKTTVDKIELKIEIEEQNTAKNSSKEHFENHNTDYNIMISDLKSRIEYWKQNQRQYFDTPTEEKSNIAENLAKELLNSIQYIPNDAIVYDNQTDSRLYKDIFYIDDILALYKDAFDLTLHNARKKNICSAIENVHIPMNKRLNSYKNLNSITENQLKDVSSQFSTIRTSINMKCLIYTLYCNAFYNKHKDSIESREYKILNDIVLQPLSKSASIITKQQYYLLKMTFNYINQDYPSNRISEIEKYLESLIKESNDIVLIENICNSNIHSYLYRAANKINLLICVSKYLTKIYDDGKISQSIDANNIYLDKAIYYYQRAAMIAATILESEHCRGFQKTEILKSMYIPLITLIEKHLVQEMSPYWRVQKSFYNMLLSSLDASQDKVLVMIDRFKNENHQSALDSLYMMQKQQLEELSQEVLKKTNVISKSQNEQEQNILGQIMPFSIISASKHLSPKQRAQQEQYLANQSKTHNKEENNNEFDIPPKKRKRINHNNLMMVEFEHITKKATNNNHQEIITGSISQNKLEDQVSKNMMRMTEVIRNIPAIGHSSTRAISEINHISASPKEIITSTTSLAQNISNSVNTGYDRIMQHMNQDHNNPTSSREEQKKAASANYNTHKILLNSYKTVGKLLNEMNFDVFEYHRLFDNEKEMLKIYKKIIENGNTENERLCIKVKILLANYYLDKAKYSKAFNLYKDVKDQYLDVKKYTLDTHQYLDIFLGIADCSLNLEVSHFYTNEQIIAFYLDSCSIILKENLNDKDYKKRIAISLISFVSGMKREEQRNIIDKCYISILKLNCSYQIFKEVNSIYKYYYSPLNERQYSLSHTLIYLDNLLCDKDSTRIGDSNKMAIKNSFSIYLKNLRKVLTLELYESEDFKWCKEALENIGVTRTKLHLNTQDSTTKSTKDSMHIEEEILSFNNLNTPIKSIPPINQLDNINSIDGNSNISSLTMRSEEVNICSLNKSNSNSPSNNSTIINSDSVQNKSPINTPFLENDNINYSIKQENNGSKRIFIKENQELSRGLVSEISSYNSSNSFARKKNNNSKKTSYNEMDQSIFYTGTSKFGIE